MRENIKPFVKWAGGKTQLLPVLLDNFQYDCKIYIEAFVGGGALFFSILDLIIGISRDVPASSRIFETESLGLTTQNSPPSSRVSVKRPSISPSPDESMNVTSETSSETRCGR